MKNKPWKFKAAGRGELTIELFSQIGEDLWSGEEGTTASSFREELEAAGPSITHIKLLINSSGGEVFSGLAIYNLLLAHKARKSAKILGLAASISSVIPMAADHITMARTALWMLHNPATLAVGDSQEMRKTADVLDRVRDSMVVAYQRKMNKSRSEIQQILQAETWFAAQEAKSVGLVAEIDPDESEEDGEQLAAAALRSPIARFFHPPARVAQIAARYISDDGDEWRRRRNRERAAELREMDLRLMDAEDDQRRRRILREHAAELATDAARPTFSDDYLRRAKMARRTEELRQIRLVELAEAGGGDVDEGRRVRMRLHAKEVAAYNPAPVTFGWPGFS